MKLSHRAVRGTVALLVIASFLLSACGSDPTATVPAPTQAPAVPTNTAAPTADVAGMVNATLTASAGMATPADVAGAVQATLTAAAPTAAPQVGFKLNPEVSGEVEFWHHWSSPVRRNAIRRVISQCEAVLPNIKITEVAKPFGDVWTANRAAVAAGSGMPDVLVSDRPTLPVDAQNEIYTDLAPFMAKDGVTGDAFYPFTWEQTLYNGDSYGMPFETDIRVLYYNKNAFREAGLDPEKPPTTWAEAYDMALKLDKQNADGTWARVGMLPIWNAGWDIWAHTNSAHLATDKGPTVNTPEAVETLEWIKTFIDHYGGLDNVNTFGAQFASPPQDRFMSGKVAMVTDVAGYVSSLNFYRPQIPSAADPAKNEALDWGIAQLPYNTEPGNWSGGFSLSIPKGADNADAAWEFIKCASGPVGSASWSRDTYAMSANIAGANDPALAGDTNWQNFVKWAENSYVDPFVPAYPNYMEKVSALLESVWRGNVTPADALTQAQSDIDAEIATNVP